jgi:hypothetical protein
MWTKREFRCLECCDFKEVVHPENKLEKPLCTVFNLFGCLSVLATFAADYHVYYFFVLWDTVIYCCKDCYNK